jgi:hypothetical protein
MKFFFLNIQAYFQEQQQFYADEYAIEKGWKN